MDYAYFVENNEAVEWRDNKAIFCLINDLHINERNIYCDCDNTKPELKELIKIVKQGDRIVVRSLFDFSSTRIDNLLTYLKILESKSVELHVLDHPCVSDYTCYYTVMHSFIELFSDYRERKRKAAYNQAQEQNRVGRKPVDTKAIKRALLLYRSKTLTVDEISELTGVSRSTIYKHLRNQKNIH
ncbi:helix-turn-helix domain-containing protein [Fusibacter ferrireducens]|uniref:Recombinase family protein n=1 Tax=Fusibacter ferrireducens TaxID=2785058 RepID=A0ABR9ZYW7_9FIRM|nr:helix-turn-helix domain-containing protein [Fusibacter ferrireducens]MBF4695085.1 recombinase family protein [Fusibacter ferrireducens]